MADLDELEKRRGELEQTYSGVRARWEEDAAYYDGTFAFVVPDNAHKTMPGTGRYAVDVPADHIVTDKPQVQRRRDPHGKREEKRDDDLEAWAGAMLQEVEEQSETPPSIEMVKNQLLRGMAILTGPFFNRAMFDAGEDMYLWYDAEDPMNVLIPLGPDPRELFFVREMTVGEMMQRARLDGRMRDFKSNGRKSNELITLVEWYGFDDDDQKLADYACYEKGGGNGREPRPSGYPYLPVRRIYSGYGRRSGGAKPEDLAVSIINAQVKSLLEDEAYAFSVCASAMGSSVWERWRGEDEAAIKGIDMDYTPGSVSKIPAGVMRIEQEALPMAVLQHLTNVQRALEIALFSGVIQGQNPEGVRTASGLAILSGQARLKFGRPMRLLESGLSQMLRNVGLLMEYLQEQEGSDTLEFPMRGRSITAGTWSGDYAVRVKLLATDPEEEAMRIARGISLWDKLPARYIGENFLRVENWAEVEEQLLYESIIKSEGYQQLLQQAIGITLQQAAQPGMPQPGGLQQMAQAMRASRTGTLQQRPRPGTVEGIQARLAGEQRRMAGVR